MVNVVEIIYPSVLVCEYVKISEFLRICGIYVYETSLEFDGWNKKAPVIDDKIFLIGNKEHISEAEKCEAKNKTYILCGNNEELQEIDLSLGRVIREDEIKDWVNEVIGDASCREFVRFFYEYFAGNRLYFYIYVANNIVEQCRFLPDVKGCAVETLCILLEDSKRNILDTFNVLESHKEFENYIYFYSLSYLAQLINEIDNLFEKPKTFGFKQVVYYCNQSYEMNLEFEAVNELKGDIYFIFADNYALGGLYYAEGMKEYNYTAPHKVSYYWKNVVKDWNHEEKYLLQAVNANAEEYEAAYRIGDYMERNFKKEEAVEIYSRITEGLRKKEEQNFLTPREFACLCMAHKRIGCIIYKDKKNPRYQDAIEEYNRIFRLWSACENNGFLKCFPEEYREDMILYHKKLFNIRGVISSLTKIYDLMENVEKREQCRSILLNSSIKQLESQLTKII